MTSAWIWLKEAWPWLGSIAITAGRVLLIAILAWVLIAMLQNLIKAFRSRLESRMADREVKQRADTLGRVFRYLAAVIVSLLAGMLILGELGISVAPILGAAGVVGLAVGFGAQSLVKDYFVGFFLLIENQISQGDVVKAGGHSGLVEEVTLRFVRLRDYDGNVHFVPNGEVKTVVNMSRGFAYAVIDVAVATSEDTDEVVQVMTQVGAQMQLDEKFASVLLAELEIAGIEKWDASGLVLRSRFKCVPLQQWNVRREYLRRLKYAFDARNIEIPFTQITLVPGRTRAGDTPDRAMRMDRQNAAEMAES